MRLRLDAGEDAGAGMLDKAVRLCDNLVAAVNREATKRPRGQLRRAPSRGKQPPPIPEDLS